MPHFAANLSMLFTDRPLTARFAAARAAGFDTVEIQFPYEVPLDELLAARDAARVAVVLINLPAGDLMNGGDGIAGVPGREAEIDAALTVAQPYIAGLGVRFVNVLAGRLAAGIRREQALDTLVASLVRVCRALAPLGVTVTCEAINPYDMPGYLINTVDDMLMLKQQVNEANFGVQFDVYHMAKQDFCPLKLVKKHIQHIDHIQFADVPGRGAPGTGTLDFPALFTTLDQLGYRGITAAEFKMHDENFMAFEWISSGNSSG
ncbi:hydroxypyruvate isomerase family protein [Microvirgula aerodenitrificans]|uniref:hydroxypyruvate isomerase family protein n=1 Tax=Microvirgula aerodenitrificans TaxID=57480 RepID=UPI00048DB23A|nr:TIM barrel protein [Microvirgula aerodenitrificans]